VSNLVAVLFACLGLSSLQPFSLRETPIDVLPPIKLPEVTLPELANPGKPVMIHGKLQWVVEEADPVFDVPGYTGWVLVVDGKSYRLNFAGNAELLGRAKALNGEKVMVKGWLVEHTWGAGRRGKLGQPLQMDARLVHERIIHVEGIWQFFWCKTVPSR
jgi:hypothetical protein